jgi:hypothetical protein
VQEIGQFGNLKPLTALTAAVFSRFRFKETETIADLQIPSDDFLPAAETPAGHIVWVQRILSVQGCP